MAYFQDIASARTKLVQVTQATKLGRMIRNNVLGPVLDQLEKDGPDILEDAALFLSVQIRSHILATAPTGRTYKIVQYDPSQPRGHRSTVIGSYTASAPGQPPARLTSTLVNSIGYEIYPDGSMTIGLLPDYGEMSDAGSELMSSGYAWGSILINEENAKQTPVGTYGRALEEGYSSAQAGPIAARPWFGPIMDEFRDEFRQRIRDNMRKSLERATKSTTVRRAIIFKVYIK